MKKIAKRKGQSVAKGVVRKPPGERSAKGEPPKNAPATRAADTHTNLTERPTQGNSARSNEEAAASAMTDDRKSKRLRSSEGDIGPSATVQDPIQFPEATEPLNTYLTDAQLQEFRELLLEKRASLAGDVQQLTEEALNGKEHGFNEQSTMPIHMADLGTDTWEQDFTLGLIANEQGLVREIDDAVARIDDRSYGMCLATGQKIGVARLRAKPWAKYCIEYERAREEGRAP